MFDNIALDVTIGLVFIYLMYSLLATTINEFVAMIFAYRHRMLEKGIEQMLDGKNYSYYWWDKVANLFFWLYHNTPLWTKKTVARIAPKTTKDKEVIDASGTKNKEVIEEAGGGLIKRKDFFKTCNVNSYKSEKQSAPIRRRKLNAKAALFAANVTNHPLYRRSSEDSLLFKKPAYLTSAAFSNILLDVLGNRKSLNNATPLLMNDIKSFIIQIDNEDLKSILNFYAEQANGDVQKFKSLLEQWFDDTMKRVSGWYKRQATKVLFLIGLILATTFNVSTIDIVHKLSINKDLRQTISQTASNYVKQRNATPPPSRPAKDLSKDSLGDQVKAQLNDIQKLYKDSIAPINMMMGLGWPDAVIYKNFTVDGKKVNTDALCWVNKQLQALLPAKVFNGYYSFLSVLYEAFSHPSMLLGFIITALAICLGAPFWFDLLNKFVNIRAGGNKPSEDAANIPAVVITNQKPASNSFA